MTQTPKTTTTSKTTLTVTDNFSDQQIQELAYNIAQTADDRKAADISLLKVTEVCYLTDYFVIITGFSKTQVRAIAEAIEDKVAQLYHRHPLQTEGKNEGNWILQDFGEVIVHIFLPEEREFYNLEAFWSQAERFEFSTMGVTQSSL